MRRDVVARATVAGCAGLVAAGAVEVLAGIGGAGGALAAVAVAAIVAGAMRVAGGDGRSSWALITAAVGLEAAAVMLDALLRPPPWPGGSRLAHLAAALLALGGLFGLRARLPDRGTVMRHALDAAVMIVAVALVATGAVVLHLHASVLRVPRLATWPVAAGAADVLLVAGALMILSRARYPGGLGLPALLPVCAGVLGLGAADLLVTCAALAGAPAARGAADAVRIGAVLCLLGGLLVPGGDRGAPMTTVRERVAVLASLPLPVATAFAVTGYLVAAGGARPAVAVGLVALGTLLLARLAIAMLVNLKLLRTLDRKVAQKTLELGTREHWFRSLVQHSSDVVTVLGSDGIVRYQSPSVERLFGHDPSTMMGAPLTSFIRPSDVARVQSALDQAAARPGTSVVLEFPILHRDGSWCDSETVITSLVDVPDVRGLVLNTRDVTDRKQLQARLTHQAFHDVLTGLANRSLFQHHLTSALAAMAAGEPTGVAVLYCDLDGFKAVNDSQGHEMGDALLGLVAERLRRCIRPTDLVARFGGDEFAVLVRDGSARRAAVELANRATAAVQLPFSLDGREVRVGVSIGIAVAEPGADSVDVLLRNADLAMYRAKADRDECVVVFETEMHDALLARLAVEDDLRTALGAGELVLHYQPTVELATGVPVGVEALMRWYRPGRGIVAPHEFIAIAEENGYIDAMGQWALFHACQQAAQWQAHARPGSVFSVGVNISARQVTPALVDVVAAAVAEAALPPSALLLEMTESVLLGRTDEAIEVLQALKRLGVRIAIDDFGTGFSSLSYLSRFPVDVLKIDKDFIDAVDRHGRRAELARTIVQLGRSLRLATIAEGIETRAQCQALLDMGCQYGQGYLFSRALPASGVTEVLCGGAGPSALWEHRPRGVGDEVRDGLATFTG